MTLWTPKHPAGVQSQWAPPPKDSKWGESNVLVYSTQIKQVRLIHVENVYRYMWHWLTEEGWKSPHKFPFKAIEDFYGEFRDQHDHKEIRWWWRVQKSHGGMGAPHPYFNYKWYIDVMTTNMKRTEIMYKGKKIKPYIGEYLMWFNAILELDPNNWFQDDSSWWLGKILEEFWLRMIYKDRMREQEIELRRASERFIEDLKHYIGLNRASDVRKPMSEERQWF
jgi:hypothetical protein